MTSAVEQTLTLTTDQLDKFCPYYFVVSEYGVLQHWGRSLQQVLPAGGLCTFDQLFGAVRDVQFKEVHNFDFRQTESEILLALRTDAILLRGSFQPLPDKAAYLFLGFPCDIEASETKFAPLSEIRSGLTNQKTEATAIKALELEALTAANRLTQLITNLQTGILLEDQDRKIVCANEEFCRLFAVPVPAATLTGSDCSQSAEQVKHLFDEPEAFVTRIGTILRERKLVLGEHVTMADKRVLSRDYIPITHAGQYLGHLWQYSDITDKLRVAEETEEQREFFLTVLNEIPADVAIFTPEHKYRFLNKQAIRDEQLRQWMVGKDDFDYFAYKGLDNSIAIRRRQLFLEATEKKAPVRFVDTSMKNGKKQFNLRIFYPYVVDGKVELVIGYGADITEQKEQELALSVERARIKDVLDAINDGVFRCDNDGVISFFNPAFTKIVGPSAHEPRVNIIDYIDPATREDFAHSLQQLRGKEDTAHGVFRLRDTDRYIDFFLTVSPPESEQHEVVGRLSDVTDQVFKEQNLGALVAKEKELSDLKTRFIRITSHELRTPLTAILSNTELLQLFLSVDKVAAPLRDKYDELARTIIKEVHRMNDLLAELIVIGRMEDGKEAFEFNEGNLTDYLHEVVTDLFDPYADGRRLQMEMNAPADSMSVFCRRMLRHAIVNVINNAFKYSVGKEAPVLRLYTSHEMITMEVEDSGIGIPEHEIDKVTSSFYRGSNAKGIYGTGIGLMLADYIIKSHKGVLSIHSQVGKGTVVRMSIPNYNVK